MISRYISWIILVILGMGTVARAQPVSPESTAEMYITSRLGRSEGGAASLAHISVQREVGTAILSLASATAAGRGAPPLVQGIEWTAFRGMTPVEAYLRYFEAVANVEDDSGPHDNRTVELIGTSLEGLVARVRFRVTSLSGLEPSGGDTVTVDLLPTENGWGVITPSEDDRRILGLARLIESMGGPPRPAEVSHPNSGLFGFEGAWRGVLTGFEAPGLYEGGIHDYDIEFIISGSEVRVFVYDDGIRTEMDKDFHIDTERTNAIVYTNYSSPGHPWTETWSFAMTHDTPDVLKVYLQRVVHNIGAPRDHPERVFALAASGEMRRVR